MLNTWRTWQFAQSLSRRTVDERVATVRRMAEWCNIAPEHADVEHIVTWLAEGGDWSANTRWTYYTALTAWFRWLQKTGQRVDNPMVMIDPPKRSKSVPHPVSNQDIQRLLKVRARRRTRAMLLLAAFQGLRAHEIAKVKGEDFDLIGRTLTVTGKGGLTATLPLHHRVVEIAFQMPRRGYWFPGVDRGHQRRESICGTIKEAMVRAGVTGSAHWLRHWFGTALLEAGVDVRVVQTLLRHQNLATTEIYTKVSSARRAEGIDRLDPFRVEPAAELTAEMRRLVDECCRDDDEENAAHDDPAAA
ncbi:tyrosine-type recombinase/integrase [Mycobacterium phage Purky]|uniref:Integrase n=1 Tax=Mycobacterium phage Purky TaxID=2593351 RepID=A0A514TWX2_9CAUD|nr:tyrosine-type recombinase/integrase [Mycobacterium phage Purky]QDK01142.1 tyrosine integrase [Mycobacterium phage Purky]